VLTQSLFAYDAHRVNFDIDGMKIISGGQTGADRAALDWAIAEGVEHGGWCPKGRLAADGPLDEKYKLSETESDGYRQRTKRNVADSDATLILNLGVLDGGTHQTLRFAQTLRKPHLVIQLDEPDFERCVQALCLWLSVHAPNRLNVAGPREEKRPGIYRATCLLLARVLSK
jgi:hypothetical protein